MVMLTSLAMTRERERGTMANLPATPVKPLEVMIGKIAPYVIIGYVQLAVIIAAATLLFEVPIVGSFSLLMVLIGLLMLANPGGLHLLDPGQKPAAGHADDVLVLPAFDTAVGLHVSLPQHAAVGTMAGRGVADGAAPARGRRQRAQEVSANAGSPHSKVPGIPRAAD